MIDDLLDAINSHRRSFNMYPDTILLGCKERDYLIKECKKAIYHRQLIEFKNEVMYFMGVKVYTVLELHGFELMKR